jgi:hypothetical protein
LRSGCSLAPRILGGLSAFLIAMRAPVPTIEIHLTWNLATGDVNITPDVGSHGVGTDLLHFKVDLCDHLQIGHFLWELVTRMQRESAVVRHVPLKDFFFVFAAHDDNSPAHNESTK